MPPIELDDSYTPEPQQTPPPAGGWIKLYRKALTDGWLREHKLFVFWAYCLLRASHKVGKVFVDGQQVELAPGQFITGRDQVSRDTGLTEQNYRTAIRRLKSTGSITTRTTNRCTIITVVNWHSYQANPGESNGLANEQTNTRPTSSQRASNDIREGKIAKKVKTITAANGVVWTLDDLFEEFWKVYPRKERKKDALRAFKRNIKTSSDANRFKAALNRYQDYIETTDKDPQHVLQGGTFFAERWEEWVDVTPPAASVSSSDPMTELDPKRAEAIRRTLAELDGERC
ncbi:MAG: hypothetical protein AB7U43_11975 [Desulfobacter sp.]